MRTSHIGGELSRILLRAELKNLILRSLQREGEEENRERRKETEKKILVSSNGCV